MTDRDPDSKPTTPDLQQLLFSIDRRLRLIEETTKKTVDRVTHELPRLQSTLYSAIESLIATYRHLDHQSPLPALAPPFGGWAITPNLARVLCDLDSKYQPTLVVELGSGSSTVLLAMLLSQRPGTRFVSLDHDAVWYAQTKEQLHAAGLDNFVELRYAPLRPVTVNDVTYQWYDPDAISDVEKVDLVFIDGPPSSVGPMARYPAGPILVPRCNSPALFVLDDTIRAEETAVITQWESEGILAQLEEFEWHSKGATVLQTRAEDKLDDE